MGAIDRVRLAIPIRVRLRTSQSVRQTKKTHRPLLSSGNLLWHLYSIVLNNEREAGQSDQKN